MVTGLLKGEKMADRHESLKECGRIRKSGIHCDAQTSYWATCENTGKEGIGVSSVGPIADEAAILGVLINPIFGGGPCLDTSAK